MVLEERRSHPGWNHIPLRTQAKRRYPTDVGRPVSTGLRQSMPDRRQPICAGVIATMPSAGDGHRKQPFSSRRT